jgi:hypothetical protein
VRLTVSDLTVALKTGGRHIATRRDVLSAAREHFLTFIGRSGGGTVTRLHAVAALRMHGVAAAECKARVLVNPSSGLGSLIWVAWQTRSTEPLCVATPLTAAVGRSRHPARRLVERRVVLWKVPHGG